MTLQCYNKSSFKHPLSNKPFAPLLPLLLFFTMRCINVTLYFTTVTVHAGWSGMVYRGAKKVSFTVYHSGKLQLALLARKWFQLRPKKLLNSRIDYGSPVIWISLKASFPARQITNIIHKPDSKIHQPWAEGWSHCLFNAGSWDLFLTFCCLRSNFMYLSFSTLWSIWLWRSDTIIFVKLKI